MRERTTPDRRADDKYFSISRVIENISCKFGQNNSRCQVNKKVVKKYNSNPASSIYNVNVMSLV